VYSNPRKLVGSIFDVKKNWVVVFNPRIPSFTGKGRFLTPFFGWENHL